MRTGSSSRFAVFVLAPLAAMGAADKPVRKSAEPYAVVAGTVFRDAGYALPGAEVLLIPEARPRKKLRILTDARGEFAFRVPAAAAKYQVKVSAKGFSSDEKPAAISGEERVEVTFTLQKESKK